MKFLTLTLPTAILAANCHDAYKRSTVELRNKIDLDLTSHPYKTFEKNQGFCSGTILNQKYILTSAYCVDINQQDWPTLEDKNSDNTFVFLDRKYEIENVMVHPEFDENVKGIHDLAILELAEEIEFGNAYKPVCLADDGDAAADDNRKCYSAGFSFWTYFTNMNSGIYQTSPQTIIKKLENSLLLVQPANPQIGGICDVADGGSGLFCGDSLVGVVSQFVKALANDGENCQVENLYTEVNSYKNWILSVIEN